MDLIVNITCHSGLDVALLLLSFWLVVVWFVHTHTDEPKMNFEIPSGLMDLLQDFTVAVLRDKPSDLVQFAAEYFNNLNDGKATQRTEKKGVSFGGGSSSDEQMQTDSDEQDDPRPGKQTGY